MSLPSIGTSLAILRHSIRFNEQINYFIFKRNDNNFTISYFSPQLSILFLQIYIYVFHIVIYKNTIHPTNIDSSFAISNLRRNVRLFSNVMLSDEIQIGI